MLNSHQNTEIKIEGLQGRWNCLDSLIQARKTHPNMTKNVDWDVNLGFKEQINKADK